MLSLKKIWEFLINNYMWLYLISGLGELWGKYTFVLQLFMFVCFVYGIVQMNRIRNRNILDVIIFVYITYILLNSLLIDYPHHFRFLIQALTFQTAPLMCYFIARTNNLPMESFFKKMMIPMAIAMVLGIYFHIAQPGWYAAIKWNAIYDRYGEFYSSKNVIEQMRLTFIWSSSYYIAYATVAYSIYLVYALTFRQLTKLERRINVVMLGICVVVLLYAQHRVTLFGFAFAYLYCMYRCKKPKVKVTLLIGAGIIFLIFIYIVYSSPDFTRYVIGRLADATTTEGVQNRFDHTGGHQDLTTFFGHGYGRYSLRAREYGRWAIIDSEYQKHLGELGIMGFGIFIIMLVLATFKGFNKKNDTGMEFCILVFYLIAFVGASALSIDSEYSFIFWYAVGKINQKSSLQNHLRTGLNQQVSLNRLSLQS